MAIYIRLAAVLRLMLLAAGWVISVLMLILRSESSLAQHVPPEPHPAGTQLRVANVPKSDTLNLRALPRPDAYPLAKLSFDASGVTATGRSEVLGRYRWLQVLVDGRIGWLNGYYLIRDAEADQRTPLTFYGELLLKPLSNGIEMQVEKAFGFIDARRRKWGVPVGAVTDGASIPSSLWSLIGSPFTGKYLQAAVIHDYYVLHKIRFWEETHDVFYEAMLVSGVEKKQALLMWAAVHTFGPRWTKDETVCWSGCIANRLLQSLDIKPEFDQSTFEQISNVIAENPDLAIQNMKKILPKARRATVAGHFVDWMKHPAWRTSGSELDAISSELDALIRLRKFEVWSSDELWGMGIDWGILGSDQQADWRGPPVWKK